MPENTLYYGDNLEVMRKYLPDASVDLVYLDPPFNSNRDYNLLFREQSGEPAQGQIKAFTDTWQWSERAYDEFCQTCPKPALVELVQGFVRTLGRNDITAYLVMMAPRLVELHRVLKPTGSLYLHCDPTASHYLKVMLDVIFGARNFRNEIVWKRTSAHTRRETLGRCPRYSSSSTQRRDQTTSVEHRLSASQRQSIVESNRYTFADTRGYRICLLT
jgi:site-specific DNA-methyltransferase (adenine-specific)